VARIRTKESSNAKIDHCGNGLFGILCLFQQRFKLVGLLPSQRIFEQNELVDESFAVVVVAFT
jgi:hypothetical protein